MPTLGFSALASGIAILGSVFVLGDPVVRVVACEELSGGKIQEYLTVEHPELSQPGAPNIELTCRGQTVEVVVRDADTGQRTERTLERSPEGGSGQEREVALAVSSLVVAARAERFPAPVEPPSKPEVANHDASEPVASVQVAGAVRVRDLPRTLAVGRGSLRAGWLPRREFEVFGQADFEYGAARRTRGRVDALSFLVGPGFAWTFRSRRRVGLETWGAILVGYGRVMGRTSRSDVAPSSVSAATGEIALGAGPRLRMGRFSLVVDLQSGYTLPTLRGRVTDEPDVRLGGVWAGVGLRVGTRIGSRRVARK